MVKEFSTIFSKANLPPPDEYQQEIIDNFIDLVNNHNLRAEMNKKMLSIDLRNGFENIWSVIREEYRKFILNR